jgi:hypothetical protein
MLNPAKGRPHLELWNSCWSAIQSLRPAFSRRDTFMWFATAVVGMMVRSDLLGLTSLIRALNLRPKLYTRCAGTFIAARSSLISSCRGHRAMILKGDEQNSSRGLDPLAELDPLRSRILIPVLIVDR